MFNLTRSQNRARLIFGALALALFLAFTPHHTALAAPAAPIAKTHKQTDGTTIAVYPMGDEYLHWEEDSGGNLIALGSDGDYHIAAWTNDGPVATAQLAPAQATPAMGTLSTPSKARQEIPESVRQQAANRRKGNPSAQKARASAATTKMFAPTAQATTTELPLLVIYAFPTDTSSLATVPDSYIESLFFDESTTALSLSNYYYQQTYGAFRIKPADASQKVLSINLTGAHSGTSSSQPACFAEPNMLEALNLAFTQINPASYDTDSDRILEADELSVVILLHGYDYAYDQSQTPGVWAHSSLIGDTYALPGSYTLDGYAMFGSTFFTNPQDEYLTMGVVAHEVGHLIFDFDDLYDIANTITPFPFVDDWSLMGSGTWGHADISERYGVRPSGLDAYSLVKNKTVTPKTVTEAIEEKLDSRNQNGAASGQDAIIKVPSGTADQYFLLQTRNRADLFDQSAFYTAELYGQSKAYAATVPSQEKTGKASGVLAFHVVETSSAYGNDSGSKFPIVTIEEAHGGAQHLLAYSSLLRKNDLADLYGATYKDLSTDTDPDTKIHTSSGRNTGTAQARILDIHIESDGSYRVDVNPVAPLFRDSDGTNKANAVDTTVISAAMGSANVYDAGAKRMAGTNPIQYALDAASLAAGFSIDPDTGQISLSAGVVAGNYTVTVTADNKPNSPSGGNYPEATLQLTFNVAGNALSLMPASLPNGVVGTAYSQTMIASGGTAPYTFALSSGSLPTGLVLTPATGVISGTPTATDTFHFAIAVTDNTNVTTTKSYTVTIAPAASTLAISTNALPSGTVGTTYSQTVSATGGTTPYTFALTSGNLPTGLVLAPATGAISGIPTASGTYNFAITVTDSTNATATKSYTVPIAAAASTLSITTSSLPNGSVGTTYSQAVSATGGTTPYTFSLTSGSLPAGLALSTSSGIISGTPTTAGTSTFGITVRDTAGKTALRVFSVTIAPKSSTLQMAAASLPSGSSGIAYNQTISITGGSTPYTFSVTSGSLPSGLSLNASTGAITGTPTGTGTWTFTVTVKDNAGASTTQSYTIVIDQTSSALVFTPSKLPMGGVSSQYVQALGVTGGDIPYTFQVASGSLPSGLSLSTDGVISGTPTAAGTYQFTITATDYSNRSNSISYVLHIAASANLPPMVSALSPATTTATTSSTPTPTATPTPVAAPSSTATSTQTTAKPTTAPNLTSADSFSAEVADKTKSVSLKRNKTYTNVTISGAVKTSANTLQIKANASALPVRFDMGTASVEMPAKAFASTDVALKLRQYKASAEPEPFKDYVTAKRLSEVWQLAYDTETLPTLRITINKHVATAKIRVLRYDESTKKLVGVSTSTWKVVKTGSTYAIRIQSAKPGVYCVVQK